MKRLIVAILAGLTASCTWHAASRDAIGDKNLPRSAILACGGHVTGSDQGGKPGPHIIWEAYSSSERVDTVVMFYRTEFGRSPIFDKDGGYTWALKNRMASLHYTVQESSAKGPWSECVAKLIGSETVVLISSMTSINEP